MTAVLSNWRGYLELTKPGVQALLFVSCASGMLIGSNFNPPVEVFFFGLIGISFLAASSAVINHFFDQQNFQSCYSFLALGCFCFSRTF